MSRIARCEKEAMVGGIKSKAAVLLLVATLSAASGCGVQEGQEQIEKVRQVEKQVEDSQRGLEEKLQEQAKEEE